MSFLFQDYNEINVVATPHGLNLSLSMTLIYFGSFLVLQV